MKLRGHACSINGLSPSVERNPAFSGLMHGGIIFLLLSMLLLSSCGKEEITSYQPPPVAAPKQVVAAPVKKEKEPRYQYKGDQFRDPFIPLTGSGLVLSDFDEAPVPSLHTLSLKGIFNDNKQKIAIIAGAGITYTLKGSMLYDSRHRLVKGVTGIIKKESVIMISPDKQQKELLLRPKKYY